MDDTIQIQFHTEDPALRNLARLYWAFGPDGQPTHSTKVLSRLCQIPSGEVVRTAEQAASIRDPKIQCQACGHRWNGTLSSRRDYSTNRRFLHSRWTCAPCSAEAALLQRIAATEA